jgi:hypothetical protein
MPEYVGGCYRRMLSGPRLGGSQCSCDFVPCVCGRAVRVQVPSGLCCWRTPRPRPSRGSRCTTTMASCTAALKWCIGATKCPTNIRSVASPRSESAMPTPMSRYRGTTLISRIRHLPPVVGAQVVSLVSVAFATGVGSCAHALVCGEFAREHARRTRRREEDFCKQKDLK